MKILTDSGPALTSVSVIPGIIMLPSVWYAGRSYQKLITSGARSAERVYFYIPEKSQYERPAGRPAVVTLFERLFLWNGMTNSRMVILIRCHHQINHVFDRYRYPPVPATARGTCRGEGVEDTLSLGNSTTAGPIAFKFGV